MFDVQTPDGTIVQFSERGGQTWLDLLTVYRSRRGQGLAREALTAVCAEADRCGVELWLKATSTLGSDLTRLCALYAEFGWEPCSAGDGITMRRTAH